MTTKERVLAYLSEWDRKGENPVNGCSVEEFAPQTWSGAYTINLNGKTVDMLVTKPCDAMPTCENEDYEAAARILRIDNPWRLPTKEFPEEGVTVLCTLGRRQHWLASRKNGVWRDSNGNFEAHPWKCMPIPDSLE